MRIEARRSKGSAVQVGDDEGGLVRGVTIGGTPIVASATGGEVDWTVPMLGPVAHGEGRESHQDRFDGVFCVGAAGFWQRVQQLRQVFDSLISDVERVAHSSHRSAADDAQRQPMLRLPACGDS